MSAKLPEGYSVRTESVTWTRWDESALRNRISHPRVAILTDPDGYERTFDTQREAAEFAGQLEDGTL